MANSVCYTPFEALARMALEVLKQSPAMPLPAIKDEPKCINRWAKCTDPASGTLSYVWDDPAGYIHMLIGKAPDASLEQFPSGEYENWR